MTFKLPYGLRSRYNASTYSNETVWKDVYGNHDAVNVTPGQLEYLVPKERFEQTENGIPTTKGFPYVKGDETSHWKLSEKFTDDSWTVAYVTRYDPYDLGPCEIHNSDGPCRARILGYGNSSFGHDVNKVGYSNHAMSGASGEVGGATHGDVTGLDGNVAQWLFAIEQPKRSIVRGGIDKSWVDRKDGLANDLQDVQIHINAGAKALQSRWNVADVMYWPRVLSADDINMVKTYLDEYAEGNIDVYQPTELTLPPPPPPVYAPPNGAPANGSPPNGAPANGNPDGAPPAGAPPDGASEPDFTWIAVPVVVLFIVIIYVARKQGKRKNDVMKNLPRNSPPNPQPMFRPPPFFSRFSMFPPRYSSYL